LDQSFEILGVTLMSGWESYMYFNPKIWKRKESRKWERVCCRNVNMLP